MCGLLLVASLSFGALALEHTGFSCTAPCGIVPDQGLNPCPLHWEVNSRPLDHQGSPEAKVLNVHLFQSTEVINGGDRMLDVARLIKNRKDHSDDRLQVPDRLPMGMGLYCAWCVAVVVVCLPRVSFHFPYSGNSVWPVSAPPLRNKTWACSPTRLGLPWWLRRWSICPQCRRPQFDPRVGKIPWRRQWHPTSVLLPGNSRGQKGLVGYSPWGRRESDRTECLQFHSSPQQSATVPVSLRAQSGKRSGPGAAPCAPAPAADNPGKKATGRGDGAGSGRIKGAGTWCLS